MNQDPSDCSPGPASEFTTPVTPRARTTVAEVALVTERVERAERSRQEIAIRTIPETRRLMLEILKRDGVADTERLAVQTRITTSGARQHLVALEVDGLIVHEVERAGPGRPRHNYRLTAAGDALFPRHYGALTNELLAYVEDEDPAMVQRIFARRGQRRLDQALMLTLDQPFAEKVRIVAQILDDDGYLADFRQQEDGAFVITEHNCAVLTVAQRYSHACSSELDFLQRALPEADVTRIAHRLNGAHVCAYRVTPHARLHQRHQPHEPGDAGNLKPIL